jgi:hypothetical protein
LLVFLRGVAGRVAITEDAHAVVFGQHLLRVGAGLDGITRGDLYGGECEIDSQD